MIVSAAISKVQRKQFISYITELIRERRVVVAHELAGHGVFLLFVFKAAMRQRAHTADREQAYETAVGWWVEYIAFWSGALSC